MSEIFSNSFVTYLVGLGLGAFLARTKRNPYRLRFIVRPKITYDAQNNRAIIENTAKVERSP